MNLIMNLRSYGTLFVQKVTAVSCAPSAFFQYSFCKVHNIAVHTVLRIIYFFINKRNNLEFYRTFISKIVLHVMGMFVFDNAVPVTVVG